MQYKVQRASEVSRYAFQKLATLWLTIICLTFAIALLMSAASAKANITVPDPRLSHETSTSTVLSSSPTPAIIHERYQSHLHPQKHGVV